MALGRARSQRSPRAGARLQRNHETDEATRCLARLHTLRISPDLIVVIALLELGSTIVYLIPRVSVLGAILMTGYLGGATATNARGDPSFVITVTLGVLVWLGLYLRDERMRALIPLRN